MFFLEVVTILQPLLHGDGWKVVDIEMQMQSHLL
jgi:hypothetical protein